MLYNAIARQRSCLYLRSRCVLKLNKTVNIIAPIIYKAVKNLKKTKNQIPFEVIGEANQLKKKMIIIIKVLNKQKKLKRRFDC